MPSVEELIEGAMEGLRLQASAHASAWGFGGESRWDADLDAGTIEFSFADGRSARAPIQIVGTYDSRSSTFLWGWDHPSVSPELAVAATRLREWGESHGAPRFTTRQVRASEREAWEFAAMANRVAEMNGVYRGPAGDTYVYFLLGPVTVSQAGGPGR